MEISDISMCSLENVNKVMVFEDKRFLNEEHYKGYLFFGDENIPQEDYYERFLNMNRSIVGSMFDPDPY
jgi:hypothetical protein